MAITAPPAGPGSVPKEKPDPKAAEQGSKGGEDRAGFDLGGSQDHSATGSTTIPGGSANPIPAGTLAAGSAGTPGMNDGDGRAVGGTAGGLKPGETTQATAGAVRPPQSTSADQTFEQGNPDHAA